jgi:DNA-binding MarR family transcriptional regulator
LRSRTGITAVEIGHALDIEKSTLSRNLKRLLALNHITMDPPAGRRGRGLHLTPKGQSVIYKAYPVWKEAQSKTMRVMGPESRTTLDSLLTQAEKLPPPDPFALSLLLPPLDGIRCPTDTVLVCEA